MDLEKIIKTLLTPDTVVIRQATKDLQQALKHKESICCLYNIMATHAKDEVRQYAALLLRKNLVTVRNYKQLTLEMRQNIKGHLLGIIFNESKNTVRGFMIQFLSVILRHEIQNDIVWTNEVLQFISNACSLTGYENVKTGTFVFSKLADFMPELFLQRFDAFGKLFREALHAMQINLLSISPEVALNLLTAMAAIVPVIRGYKEIEETYEMLLPSLLDIMKVYAARGQQGHFSAALDVLQNISECTPYLLNQILSDLLDFTLSIGSNWANDSEIRMKALSYLSIIVSDERKLLVKLNLVEPMINVIFNIMATEPESDDADEFFVESASETPLATANLIMDAMASNIPPEKFLPPLLALLGPTLKDFSDNLRRRAAYITLATISEGCREAICEKYLDSMLYTLKQGINDSVSSVRNAALYAVGQFSEQLQPEIANYAADMMPLLLKCMQDVLQKYQIEHRLESKHTNRVFYAVEAFCSSVEDALTPYLENLMYMILPLLANEIPPRLSILSLSLCETIAEASKGNLLPWFEQLLERLRPLLMRNEKSDPTGLRSQAINTLAAIIRNVDKQFLPYAGDTMYQSVNWIEQCDDSDVWKSLINLFGALASIVGNDVAPILPTILNQINRCLDESSSSSTAMNVTDKNVVGDGLSMDHDDDGDDDDDDYNGDEDIDQRDGSSDEKQFSDDDPYLNAKIQAILTVKELAESCMKTLLPFTANLFHRLHTAMAHCSADIRKSSILAVKTLTIRWYENDPNSDAKQAVHAVLVKLEHIIRKDNWSVVIEAQQSMADILLQLGTNALGDKQMSDSIALCIQDGLTNKYMCLLDGVTSPGEGAKNDGYSESESAVVEEAANMITSFANAISPDEFASYFQLLEPLIMEHIKNNSKQNGFFVGVLAECFSYLGANVAPYFHYHFHIFIDLAKHSNLTTRRNAIFGLGELMRTGNYLSYGYFLEALETLFQAINNEIDRSVVENAVGALARLILVNASLVPLATVVPLMLQNLPIEDDEDESVVVIESFDTLYSNFPDLMQNHTGDIIGMAIRTLNAATWHQPLVDAVNKLIQRIRSLYPGIYEQILATFAISISLTPTLASFPF